MVFNGGNSVPAGVRFRQPAPKSPFRPAGRPSNWRPRTRLVRKQAIQEMTQSRRDTVLGVSGDSARARLHEKLDVMVFGAELADKLHMYPEARAYFIREHGRLEQTRANNWRSVSADRPHQPTLYRRWHYEHVKRSCARSRVSSAMQRPLILQRDNPPLSLEVYKTSLRQHCPWMVDHKSVYLADSRVSHELRSGVSNKINDYWCVQGGGSNRHRPNMYQVLDTMPLTHSRFAPW